MSPRARPPTSSSIRGTFRWTRRLLEAKKCDGWMDGRTMNESHSAGKHPSTERKKIGGEISVSGRRKDRACCSALEETSAYAWWISTRPSPRGSRSLSSSAPPSAVETNSQKLNHIHVPINQLIHHTEEDEEEEGSAGSMTFFFSPSVTGFGLTPALIHYSSAQQTDVNGVNEEEQRRPG